jgi:hypothetical protein
MLAFFPVAANGQQKEKPEPSSGMGVATGAAHAAVKDSQHRPITAGGFVDNAPIVFIVPRKRLAFIKAGLSYAQILDGGSRRRAAEDCRRPGGRETRLSRSAGELLASADQTLAAVANDS